jgi:uncharacterized peroxidase-related enzyme
MSRIPAVDPSASDPKAQPLLAAIEKLLGSTPNLYRVAAQSPAALEGLVNLNGALAKGKLGAKVRESIALAVAEANACDYCLSAHSALSKRAGLSDAAIAKARDGQSDDPKTAAALNFAKGLVANRGRATDGEIAALRSAGLNDGEIVEIVAITVANLFTNYLNHVAGTDIDFPVVRAGLAAAA